MQTPVEKLRLDEQSIKDQGQVDLIICRSHLASFFWQLDHVFEALDIAIKRGQKDYPKERFFYSQEQVLEKIRQTPIPKEIAAYRNEGHNMPAIIGQKWEEKGGKFLHHFLPSIQGHETKDSMDLNEQLHTYFEYVANVWRDFVPEPLKGQFPRSFRFPVANEPTEQSSTSDASLASACTGSTDAKGSDVWRYCRSHWNRGSRAG